MNQVMTERVLERETLAYRGSGGISAENRSQGFHPAFLDTETGVVYASCYADGRRAPFHLLDGLPNELVLARDPTGRAAAVKAAVASGFVRDGRFYTREEAANQASTRPERDIRVMLVDDHDMTRHLLRELIDDVTGLTVVAEAADGESAVETARRANPDVILMDISMPKMNGIDATRQIMAENAQVKIIALSLHDEPGTREAMQAVGAAAYLSKDDAFQVLCATIRELMAWADRPAALPTGAQNGSSV